MNKSTDYDLVIVGAGLAGCLLALATLKLSPHLKVALLDDNPENADRGSHPGFDARSIALSAGSCELLADMGIWAALKEQAQAIDDINVSDRGHYGVVDLASSAKQPFGHVVELQNVGAALEQRLAQLRQLTRFYHARLSAIEKYREQLTCQLQDGRTLSAKLCVAADGANSLTRELLGITSQASDYGCTAIIANLLSSKAHLNKAYERFTEAGPIALLPLTENRYSLVWSVKNSDLARLSELSEHAFLSELQSAFGYRAGIFKTVGKRDFYPMQLIKVAKPLTHRGVCIGNAAHCLHPVMGQGFNLGLRDLYALAQVISSAAAKEQLGDYQMLQQYWSMRNNDHQKTIAMTDSMVRIFSSNHWPLVFARNAGLQAMRCFPGLTQPIVKQAKGQFNLKEIKN